MNDQPTLIQALTQTHRTIKGLVESLTDDELSVPYHPGINPPVWELGHTAHFFEVFILRALDGAAAWNPGMDDIWDSFNIDHRDRWTPGIVPNREDTIAYVDAVHDAILSRMAARPPSPVERYLYRYAIYHQSMHIESLLWCRQTLGYQEAGYGEAICAHDGASAATASTAAGTSTEDVVVEPGVYRIGVLSQDTYDADAFAFDNEKPGFDIELDAFRISPTLVSNARVPRLRRRRRLRAARVLELGREEVARDPPSSPPIDRGFGEQRAGASQATAVLASGTGGLAGEVLFPLASLGHGLSGEACQLLGGRGLL
jgi:iron(II)-dependent oxidoreductase